MTNRWRAREFSTVIILLVEVVFFAWYLWPEAGRSHPFLNFGNFLLIFKYSSIYGIAAIGAAVVIISGGIDLAPGAIIALTTEDLFPEPSWNFVFGQASPSNRTGVWSMQRFGDPSKSPQAFRLALMRTAKTASHETAHMLGISHCVAYECLMNGSNNLAELDARPMDLCPPCLQKLCWSTGVPPLERARRLHEFFVAHGLIPDGAAEARVEKVLESRP